MKMTELFLSQLEREAAISRRVLGRVPEGRSDWKPHEKSMPLGYLATLVATMPAWIAMTILKDSLDLNPPEGPRHTPPQWSTTAELLAMLDDSVAQGKDALAKTTDDHLLTPWRLLYSGQTVMEHPRHIVIADTLNHRAHHRGQLTVYLRLNEVPVPSIYGPSADERQF
ncbi:MAG TPA: DinB family protein [Acidobacteriota bacterium]|nr:DinB family protein [Acidobacteriota bacterium]